MKLFIDINTGLIRTGLNASPVRLLRFFLGNRFQLSVVLMDGGDIVTSAAVVDPAKIKMAIKGAVRDANPLIEVDEFAVTGEIGVASVDLTVDPLTAYFANFVPDSAPQWMFNLEFQIEDTAASNLQTIAKTNIIIARDALPFTPHVPQAITDNSGTSITDNAGNEVTSN